MIVVQGVTIPINSPKDFVTSDWDEVLAFYPQYFRKVLASGVVPCRIQDYMIAVSEELERCGARDERIANVWLHRALDHFGAFWIQQYFSQYYKYAEHISRLEAQR